MRASVVENGTNLLFQLCFFTHYFFLIKEETKELKVLK